MTFDYARAAGTAERLVRKFGAVGAIRRTTVEGANLYDPSSGTEVVTDHPAMMVSTTYSAREIDGTRIRATDIKVIIEPATGIEPTTSDKVVAADGAALTIINIDVLRPATTTVLWTLQCRR